MLIFSHVKQWLIYIWNSHEIINQKFYLLFGHLQPQGQPMKKRLAIAIHRGINKLS